MVVRATARAKVGEQELPRSPAAELVRAGQ
jgi:hypothetical protein